MESVFSFVPKEGPLTIFGELLIGTVYLGQYQVHLRGYCCYAGSTALAVYHNPCLSVPVYLPEMVVESWAQWKALLARTPGEIRFGEGFEDAVLSLEEFIKIVEERAGPRVWGRDGKLLSSPYDYMLRSPKDRHRHQMEDHDMN